MKKIEYLAPEMEVIEFKVKSPLLEASGETAGQGGAGNEEEELD